MNNFVKGPVSRGWHFPMTLPRVWQVLCLTCCLLVPALAQAATPLFQSSFHKPTQDWTVVRGSAASDPAVSHGNNPSLRVEHNGGSQDASISLAPVAVTLGKSYELSGWVRTEDLEVRDLDRSPIASGATLSMASMPFDVHSTSVGGTQPWTHLTLRFVASRTRDQILLTVGNGGSFSGKAWFEGIQLDEAAAGDDWPASRCRRDLWPRLSISCRRLDLSPH